MIAACVVCGKEFVKLGNAKACSKECSRERTRERDREYCEKNREKNREMYREYCRRYREMNRERIREHGRKTYKEISIGRQILANQFIGTKGVKHSTLRRVYQDKLLVEGFLI